MSVVHLTQRFPLTFIEGETQNLLKSYLCLLLYILNFLMIKMLQYKMYPAGELRCPTTALVLISAQNHRLWVFVRTASVRQF